MPPLAKLEKILEVLNDSLSKADFVKAFEGVVEFVQKIQATNDKEFTNLKGELNDLAKKVKEDASTDVAELRQQVELVVGAQMATIKAKLASVKDGRTPVKGVDYFNGEDGLDATPPTKEELLKLIKPLIPKPEKGDKGDPGPSGNTVRVGWGAHPLQVQGLGVVIDKNTRVINFAGSGLASVVRSRNGVVTVTLQAGGAGATVYSETPTGLIDGLNTVYTTAHDITTVYNLAINGQFLHPTTDYTVTDTAEITLTTALDSTLSGLPFTITYA